MFCAVLVSAILQCVVNVIEAKEINSLFDFCTNLGST